MPAKLSTETIDRVKEFWAAQRDKLDSRGRSRSRRDLYKIYVHKYGREPSWGKFAEIIAEIERNAPADGFPTSEWIPWVNSEESAEESAFLLRIKTIKEAELGIGLYTHEANWGRRLRVALEGLHPFGQYRFILAYSLRDIIRHHLRAERITDDLDSFVVYQPWLPGNFAAYELAIASGIAPKLKMDPFASDQQRELRDLLPGPQNFTEEVRLSWAPQLLWMLRPWGTFVPGCENDPEKADMLGQILDFWAGAKATDVSKLEEGTGGEQQP